VNEFTVEVDQEEDGRWIADVPALPGVMVYAATRADAVARAKALAIRVLADRIEHGEFSLSDGSGITFVAA
jgi:predicted RNase H-like HicB family nuclease